MPDGMGGFNSQNKGKLIQACEKYWENNKGDCSGYLKAVAEELGVYIPNMQANGIYDYLHAKPPTWNYLGIGLKACQVAGLEGAKGNFVVAAWKNLKGNGHVAIVVDYSKKQDRALAYWGSLGSVGKSYTKISDSFSRAKLKETLFSSCVLGIPV